MEQDFEKQKQAHLEASNQALEMTQRIPLRQRRMLEEARKSTQSEANFEPKQATLPVHGGFVGFFAALAQIVDLGSTGMSNYSFLAASAAGAKVLLVSTFHVL